MYIKQIRLYDFRNYEKLELDFSQDCNIIYGNNAQGKTNILEAIFVCAAARSHRTSHHSELIRIGGNGYGIVVETAKEDRNLKIEVQYSKEENKKIKINEIPVKKIGELIGNLNVVSFSPEDLMIIKEGPSERRRFMDIAISQLKPSYFYDLQQYLKILHQRNALLKESSRNISIRDTIDVWDMNLVKVGSRIIKTRNEFIRRLSKHVEKKHSVLTNSNENLRIRYTPSFYIGDLESIEDIEKSFQREIDRKRDREIQKMTTLSGPQRDDIDMQLNDKDIKLYGSQGQQRTAILSLKTAEIEIMKEETQEYPIVLLDDVMSELDNERKEYLIDSIKDVQSFITTTEKDFFGKKKRYNIKYFFVRNGTAKEEYINDN